MIEEKINTLKQVEEIIEKIKDELDIYFERYFKCYVKHYKRDWNFFMFNDIVLDAKTFNGEDIFIVHFETRNSCGDSEHESFVVPMKYLNDFEGYKNVLEQEEIYKDELIKKIEEERALRQYEYLKAKFEGNKED